MGLICFIFVFLDINERAYFFVICEKVCESSDYNRSIYILFNISKYSYHGFNVLYICLLYVHNIIIVSVGVCSRRMVEILNILLKCPFPWKIITFPCFYQ